MVNNSCQKLGHRQGQCTLSDPVTMLMTSLKAQICLATHNTEITLFNCTISSPPPPSDCPMPLIQAWLERAVCYKFTHNVRRAWPMYVQLVEVDSL